MATPRTFQVGRGRECHVVLADESVSRTHAEITVLPDGTYVLRDCNSTAGTIVHRQGRTNKIKESVLAPGDVLQFGEIRLTLQELVEALPAIPAAPHSSAQPSNQINGGQTDPEGPAKAQPHLLAPPKSQPSLPALAREAAQAGKQIDSKPAEAKAAGAKKTRCSCGAIKSAGSPCKQCGQ